MFSKKNYSRQKKYTDNSSYEKLKEIITTIPSGIIDTLHRKVVGPVSEKPDIRIAENTNINKDKKPNLKLLKTTNHLKIGTSSNDVWEKPTENQHQPKPLKTNKEHSSFFQDKRSKIDNTSNPVINENNTSGFVMEKHEAPPKEKPVNIRYIDSSNPSTLFPEKDTEINNKDKEEVLKAIFKHRENDICPSVKTLCKVTGLYKNTVASIKKEFEKLNIIQTAGLITTIISSYSEASKILKSKFLINNLDWRD
jgi:hypothetical protein